MKPSIELIRLVAVILITFTHTRNNLENGISFFIVEQLPTFGTAILSIISGYLYYTVSRKKKKLFLKKLKSLAVPYLFANIVVLLLVLTANFVFGYNALNRLTYDFSLITEGILALNSPPINPPTYFIRDIFIIFSIIALFTQKEYKALFILIPVVLFGTLVLRLDVAFLFTLGVLYAIIKDKIDKKILIVIATLLALIVGFWFFEYLKLPLSFLIFILILDLEFKFFNTGRYSYLLHLYHSPIIVVSYPILKNFIHNPLINIIAQIIISVTSIYIFFLITKKYDFLKILSGGR